MESFKLQVSLLNNQVEILLKKLNYLEKYLSEQTDLRQRAENQLQEVLLYVNIIYKYILYCTIILKELILKSKAETEKLEIIAMLTNLKLINVKLTKENRELKEMIINNQNTQNTMTSSCTSDTAVSRNK